MQLGGYANHIGRINLSTGEVTYEQIPEDWARKYIGAPREMLDVRDELTPMMAQYFELCRAYDDSLVLFQVGDFYEAFCEAAERVSRLCEVALTKREDSTGTYPMAGIPIDNAASYVEGLLDAGYRVAVADQVEDPEEVTGPVERAVTRVVTPGTLTEIELLGGADNNFVAALARETRSEGTDERPYGLAMLDVSTGAGSCAELVAAASRAGAATRELEGVPLNRLDNQLRELVAPLGVGEKTPPLAGQDGVADLDGPVGGRHQARGKKHVERLPARRRASSAPVVSTRMRRSATRSG